MNHSWGTYVCGEIFPSLNWLYTLQTSILIGYAVLVSVKPVSTLGLYKSPGCSCISKALEGTRRRLARVAPRASPLFCCLFWTTVRPAEDFPTPAVLWGPVPPILSGQMLLLCSWGCCYNKEFALRLTCNFHSGLRGNVSLLLILLDQVDSN